MHDLLYTNCIVQNIFQQKNLKFWPVNQIRKALLPLLQTKVHTAQPIEFTCIDFNMNISNV